MTANAYNPKLYRLYKIYGATVFTGIIRAYYKSGFAEKTCYTDDFKKTIRPYLFTERTSVSVIGGIVFASPFMPICMYNDIRRIETNIRGLDINIYNTKISNFFDIIF